MSRRIVAGFGEPVPLFRCTKKLATALHVKLPTGPIEHENSEHAWFCDLFYVEGKKCVVWVHGTTLLGFVLPAATAADLREFPALFRFECEAALTSMSLPVLLLERFGVLDLVSYAPTNDRRVVGSMLDYRNMFEHMVAHDGGLLRADIRAINQQLSDTPMSVIGMDSAVRKIRAMLTEPSPLH